MNNTKDDGGTAFPTTETLMNSGFPDIKVKETAGGLSIRDYFAAAALQGFCACPITVESWQAGVMAEQAYLAADAMLSARKERA